MVVTLNKFCNSSVLISKAGAEFNCRLILMGGYNTDNQAFALSGGGKSKAF